ncbi:MAG: ABC transporter permease [Dehalococcoidia bacterium]
MESLFGISTSLIARVLAGMTLMLCVGIALLASRRRTLLKLGVRNALRRPLRTSVIVIGVMLSTVVVATAFTTGDAMTLTIQSLVTGSVGKVDEVVTSSQGDFTQVSASDLGNLATGGSTPRIATGYFPAGSFTTLRDRVAGSHAIAGVLPAILEQAPVADGKDALAHPNVGLLAVPPDPAPGFGTLRDTSDQSQSIGALGAKEVFLNRAAAGLLGSGAGHQLRIYLPVIGAPASAIPGENDFSVRAVLQDGVLAGPQPVVLLPLGVLQGLLGQTGQVNEILVVNRCPSDPAACSQQAALDLRKVLVDRNAAESIRQGLASSSGQSVLNGLISRRTGRGADQVRDLKRTVLQGRVTDHLIYLLGDPQVAGTLRATAGFLPTRDGRAGRTLRTLNPLTVIEVKRGALNEASDYASVLTSSFLVLGLFSIAASLLLVFLVFVMLAAERRSEMGIARAIGLRRSHLIQSFVFEGGVYDLAAALLGIGAGVAVSGGIVWLVARALAGYGVPVQRHVESRSLVIAFCLGVIMTFVTVVFSAWRVSVLNVVEAIRGISDEAKLGEGMRSIASHRLRSGGAGMRSLALGRIRTAFAQLWHASAGIGVLLQILAIRGALPLVAGFVLFSRGRSQQQYLSFALGVTLLILGGGLLFRWLLLIAGVMGARAERFAYTLAGGSLTAFWAVPPPSFHGRTGQYSVGSIETFALAGVMMVFGLVWVVAYNIAGPLELLLRLFGRGGSVTAALRMAVAYPLQHRLRTGMAVAMFSLVVFTMVVSAVLLDSAHNAYVQRERPPSGYDISATVPAKAGITDLSTAISTAQASRPDEFAGIGAEKSFTADVIEPSGTSAGWRRAPVRLVDQGFASGTRLRLSARATGYASDNAVWDALGSKPGMALVAKGSLPAFGSAGSAGIDRIKPGQATFTPESLWLRDGDGAPVRLTIAGVVDDSSALSSGILTLASNLTTARTAGLVPSTYLLRTQPARDPAQAALGLDLSFGLQGVQTTVVGEGLRNVQTVRQLLNYLLEGFVGLGLVSGMAALGVISTRAVVERRQQIGMMRAIGLQRRLVRLSFLLEISFIALLGVGVGVVLGVLLARNVVTFLQPNFRELRLTVPWAEVGLIAAIAFLAALSATLVAAWQAGRVLPAEALRYE